MVRPAGDGLPKRAPRKYAVASASGPFEYNKSLKLYQSTVISVSGSDGGKAKPGGWTCSNIRARSLKQYLSSRRSSRVACRSTAWRTRRRVVRPSTSSNCCTTQRPARCGQGTGRKARRMTVFRQREPAWKRARVAADFPRLMCVQVHVCEEPKFPRDRVPYMGSVTQGENEKRGLQARCRAVKRTPHLHSAQCDSGQRLAVLRCTSTVAP